MTKPIGIYGGSFDPMHIGHLQVAIEAHHKLALQEVRIIPCYQSPFKKPPIASPEQRIAMIKLTIKEYPYLKLDCRELKRCNISYTIDTLKSLQDEYSDTALYLIISEDAYANFTAWNSWEQILEITDLVVVNRPNSPKLPNHLPQHYRNKVHHLHMKPNPISATEIRTRLKKGQSIKGMVVDEVERFIANATIYVR